MTMTSGATRTVPAKREILHKKNELVRMLTDAESAEELAFFCECGRDGCAAPAWHTGAEYDTALASGEPLRAEGH
jgi:hypothetical protein